MPTLPCENGGGSLNNLANQQIAPTLPYVPKDVCMGSWEITSTDPDLCAINEANTQESYVAESLNISGAPINIYKLLGVHEQGAGSVLPRGKIVTSSSFPGFPANGINTTSWRSLDVGTAVANRAWVGIDFGIKQVGSPPEPEYAPSVNNWTNIGSVTIAQSNLPGYWAQQVRVDITDGTTASDSPILSGVGTGTLSVLRHGPDASQSVITAVALTPTTFNCYVTYPDSSVTVLGQATVGEPFNNTFVTFVIAEGAIPFVGGDIFTVNVNYEWKRVALFSLTQTSASQTLGFQHTVKARALRIVPTMFTGSESWEVISFDVSDSVPTNINNVQDLFFNENRDRDYALTPITLKTQYTPADSVTDLSKFGISIMDQYVFTVSFASMVNAIGRPIVTGDIIEVIPELQYDQNLKPVRKFLEVTDTGWASAGYGPGYKPFLYRFNAQQALPSQETRDIFGTLDTQKYLIPDQVLSGAGGNILPPLNTAPLTNTEELPKEADDAVPETGSNDMRTVQAVPTRHPLPPVNAHGNPPAVPVPNPTAKSNLYVEAALPPNNAPYLEGFKLPSAVTAVDGEYFRLYYPPETKIPARLYRFSAVKNSWIYLETDRRSEYSSFKPSVQAIMASTTKKSLGTKL